MKKVLLICCIAFVGCKKDAPKCVTCFDNGIEVFSACLEDYPDYDDIHQLRDVVDSLLGDSEECAYHN